MSQRSREKPNIFRYLNYREYIKDWLFYKKENQSYLSKDFAKELGVTSAYLSMVFKSARKFPKKKIHRLKKCMNLQEYEFNYLKKLMVINDSEDSEARWKALAEIKRYSGSKEHNENNFSAHEYLSKWYYVAIREMSRQNDFRADLKFIQNKLVFKVSKAEVAAALKYLRDNELLYGQSKGAELMDCDEGIFKISLHEFHSQVFDLLKDSITKVPREERFISGTTVSLNETDFLELKKDMQNLLEKYAKHDKKNKGARVYHIETATVPLTMIK